MLQVVAHELAADSTLRLYHEGKNGRGELLANHAHGAGVWWLTWVGDLNRDGAADLLVQTTGRDLQRYHWLYMSGTVAADRRWRPAAVESHEGCGE